MNERASLHPILLRVTFEEKANLEKAAAGMSLSAFIRWKLFDPSSPPPHRRGAFPVKDHRALAQLLALLGQSRLANNVNQLAKAANTGSLPVTPETEEALLTAVEEVAQMRALTCSHGAGPAWGHAKNPAAPSNAVVAPR